MISRRRSGRKSECFEQESEFAEPSFLRRSLRKRKRRESENSDCLSVHSLDISFKEPSRRKKRLSRVASLANLFSPVRPVMKVGEALQRTWSGVKISSPVPINKRMSMDSPVSLSPSSSPPSNNEALFTLCSTTCKTSHQRKSHEKTSSTATSAARTRQRVWRETVGRGSSAALDDREICRQEAIFELYQGEEDMVEDLHLVKSTYHDSLLHLNILTNEELQQIFGSLHVLEPLHHDLVVKLSKLRDENGVTKSIGDVLIEWIPCLNEYVDYCANQVYAKAMLDEKKTNDRRVGDFLQRCLESPFSRKLDLWNFLDVPRNRLVKYPLLIRNIIKLTSDDHSDMETLQKAVTMIEQMIGTVDKRMGESECKFYINKLDFLDEQQRHPSIDTSTCLLCKGILRNNRGTKLNAFLFDKVLVLSRPVTRGDKGRVYQVYRQPMPVEDLIVEDVKDAEAKMGSFRSAFTHTQAVKNIFRVTFRNPIHGQGHTLQATDEHDKKQWLHNLHKLTPSSDPSPSILRAWDTNERSAEVKRSSSSSSIDHKCLRKTS